MKEQVNESGAEDELNEMSDGYLGPEFVQNQGASSQPISRGETAAIGALFVMVLAMICLMGR